MSSFVTARLSASALLARPAKALPAVQRRQALISLVLATRGFGSAAGAQQTSQTCANAMVGLKAAKIIPDIIDRVSPASAAELEVAFHGKAIQNGQLISPKDAAAAPKVHIRGGSEGGLFTLLASDPDPPDPANPVYREWLHWIVTNIPAGGDASQGTEVAAWRGPSPPIGTHRYVFLLYQQPNQEPLQVADPSGGEPSKRAKFNTRSFAKAHNLGDPVAVTWFNSHK
ncbi:hypothetical protein COHA_001255 [Chlorella ohadii]|uniref:Uncharacterized protein n=1 Tax=Chlorella ohadii TaxID=2649997 RepID=A0AAD5H625_9CHLO|nr:hypothetical protein COHA_001255 [Chlorella ohadii]